MSITATYRRVSAQKFAELNAKRAAAQEFFYPFLDIDDPDQLLAKMKEEQESGRTLDLEKEWHALHFLLTSESSLDGPSRVPPPLCNVVMGGTPTQFEATYGKVRSLSPPEVREVADALSRISVEELKRRFDPAAFNAAEIYPNPRPGGWDVEQLEPLFYYYPRLVEFFKKAAERGDIVLLSSD